MFEKTIAIDPGNQVAKPHTLAWVADFVRRHPNASTGQGEAGLLVAEIDRLTAEVEKLKKEISWRSPDVGTASDWDTGVGGAGR